MPVHPCRSGGKPGYMWGSKGKCYTYTKGNKKSAAIAYSQAQRQGRAAYAHGYKAKKDNQITIISNNETNYDKISKSLELISSTLNEINKFNIELSVKSLAISSPLVQEDIITTPPSGNKVPNEEEPGDEEDLEESKRKFNIGNTIMYNGKIAKIIKII